MPQEPVKCPACKGIEFEMPKDKANVHLKCRNCGIILYRAVDAHYATHAYCGAPDEHWRKANEVF